MSQMPPAGRRTSNVRPGSDRNGMPPVRTKKRKKSRLSVIFSLLVCAALLTAFVLLCPWEPISHAIYSAGTEDGSANVGAYSNAYAGLKISEVMASNTGAVPDENGAYPDWVEVWNSSDSPINLKGVGLSDRGDSIRFLFPDETLAPDGRVIVFCDDTNQGTAGGTYHAKFKLSSVGETVYLFDASAYTIDSVQTPIMGSDSSYSLLADGTWQEVSYYSPGYENTEAGFTSYRTATTVSDGALIINEVMADALTGLADEDGELSDWVELYNTTDQTISLANYALSNKESKPLKWRFPEGAVIAPNGYYIVFCSGKDRDNGSAGVPHSNFRISAEHDTIVLSDSRGRMVDRVTIDNLAEDCSYARNESGTFEVLQMATPGLPNNQAGMNQMDKNLRAMNATGVYVSEVMASDDSVATYSESAFSDWVELYNASAQTVDLSNYGLSDNLGRARKWQFPEGTMIAPGEYKLVALDGKAEQSTAAQPHASFKLLRAGGEVICLSDPTGKILDKITLPKIPTNISYGRTTGLSGFFYYDAPTPMAANSTGFIGYADNPSFTSEPGMYYATVYTTIAVPEGTTVHYTTDSTDVTANSPIYNGEQIEMNKTTVLRARAYSSSGYQPSDTITGTYFVNAYHSLPIVSVVTDPDNLWNETDGMLTLGSDVTKVAGELPFKNTVYRAVKNGDNSARPVHVEYYLLDGTQVLNQDAQFELSGDYSLDMPQKSMKFRAKSLYGAKTFAASLFGDRDFTEYKGFVLRNSGNDSMSTRVQDGFQSRLLDAYGTTVLHQSWNPMAVYINGQYWGEMNMRERIDRFFVAQHEGLTFDQSADITILQANASVKYGSNKDFKAMYNKIKASDPANNPQDLQYILDNVDVDNYFEYIALEMFVGNSDIGNTRYYRTNQPGSKWKWIWYDADYGLYNSAFDSPKSYTKVKGMGQQNIYNAIFLRLIEVPEYKDKFLLKLADVYKTFTTDFMIDILEKTVAEIEPEMQLHWARWGEENDPFVLSEAPTTADGAYRYWQQRVERLRNVCRLRPRRLWDFIKDGFSLSQEQMVAYFDEQPEYPAGTIE